MRERDENSARLSIVRPLRLRVLSLPLPAEARLRLYSHGRPTFAASEPRAVTRQTLP